MALKLKKWDSAEHLKTEEDVAAYWEACLEEAGDFRSWRGTGQGRGMPRDGGGEAGGVAQVCDNGGRDRADMGEVEPVERGPFADGRAEQRPGPAGR